MDYDERNFLYPEEEFEAMFAEEEEMVRELEEEQRREDYIPRKSLNFDQVPDQIHTTQSRSSRSNTGTPHNSNQSKRTSSSLVPDFCLPSTSKGLPDSFNQNGTRSTSLVPDFCLPSTSKGLPNGYTQNGLSRTPFGPDYAVPSTSKESPPLPFADLDESLSSSNTNIRISTHEESRNVNSNKRSVEELFGDIDDIDFNVDPFTEGSSFLRGNKRSRVEEVPEVIDKDLLMIERILKKREIIQNQNKDDDVFSENLRQKRSNVILSRRVPKYAFITLRNGNNEKFYAKLISDNALNNKIVSVSEQCKTCRLLAIPFENIMVEANAIMEKKFVASEQAAKSTDTQRMDMEKITETELWVEKYKPASYLDLLSDEGTNKILLQWLKLWDKVVFGRERRVKNRNHQDDNHKFSKWNTLQLDCELDESGCPKHKIALLCGAPGLGKTTLAHVIAKHAGYNVVEMNASDDRSPDVFRHQLEAATQMRAVIGKSPKPNCLIVDEIDGAPTASIECLIKFAKEELKGKGKKKKTSSLRRPIICICNDVYVPALRSLRQMAFVVHFPPTSQNKLAQRLVQVAMIENIKTDIGAMLALCEKTNNDIRSCISTIYCLKQEPIKTATIRNANVGSKDMQKGLFTVWQEIFQINMKNIEHSTADITSQLGRKNKSDAEMFRMKRMVSILRTVQSNGDYDRLIQGVHENFLSVPINDSSMRNVSAGLDWFCVMDHLKATITRTQMYTLMGYIPYSFVAWNFLFATYQRPKLNYPNSNYELSVKQAKHYQIIQEVLKGMEVKIRAYCHYEQLLLDTLPLITSVLNPAFRQVSIQLFSNAEKEALRQLVNVMIDYNLNFVQERTQDGSYEFNLDPNVDHVVEFPGVRKIKHLTYSLKLMIAREIEQEKIRRLEKVLLKTNLNDIVNDSAPMDEVIENDLPHQEHMEIEPLTPEIAAPDKPRAPNHLQKLTPKVIKKSPTCTVTKDFFGRLIEKPSVKKQNAKVDEIVKSDIWFHFKEGFSNAVRRTVYIRDLL